MEPYPQAARTAGENQCGAHPSGSAAVDFGLYVPVLRYCRSNTTERLVPGGSKHLPRAFRFHWHGWLVVRAQE